MVAAAAPGPPAAAQMVRHVSSSCSLADAAPRSQEREQLRAMEAAVKQLLVNVGEDPLREGLVDTPRVSRIGRWRG